MRLTVDKSQLLKALSHAQSVVEKRHTVPILGHALLDASGDGLTLTSTDMELSLVEKIGAVIETPGRLSVSATMFFDIVRKMDADTLTLFEKDGQLHIHGGRSKFKIASLSAEDFPRLNASDLPHSFSLKAEDIKRLFDKPRFAMANEETRYYLNGIYWHIVGGENVLRAVATDAHRLAYAQIGAPEGTKDMPGVIISRKTVNEVRKLLDEGDEDVKISLSPQRIEFSFKTKELSSRLIDGTFPDYMQAIPSENNKIFYLPTKDYAHAVDRVATVVNDKVRVIKLDLKQNQLTLSALSQELGSAQEELPVAYENADSLEIGFNAKYLLDIAQQIDEEETQVSLGDSNSPAVIRGAGNDNNLYVIMPMRI